MINIRKTEMVWRLHARHYRLDGRNDAGGVQPKMSPKVFLITDARGKPSGRQSDSPENGWSLLRLHEHFRNGAAEPSENAVLFECENCRRFARGGNNGVAIQRAHRVHAEDSRAETSLRERVRGCDGIFEKASGRDEREVDPLTHLNRLT